MERKCLSGTEFLITRLPGSLHVSWNVCGIQNEAAKKNKPKLLPQIPARIPSPRELVVHTQSIMQGALLKKKLEEQKENYRRRHEVQPKQPTPISFTPTSVSCFFLFLPYI